MHERGIWTRISKVAESRGMTVSRFAQLSDAEILREPNMGKLSLKVLRRKYPLKSVLEMPIGDLRDQLDHIQKVLDSLEKLLRQREN